jgi:hypothetical protein
MSHGRDWQPRVTTRIIALRLAAFLFGCLSVGSLLLYFYGAVGFASGAFGLLFIEIVGLAAVAVISQRTGAVDVTSRLAAGLWAGAVATLAYDVVRVPIAREGIPVFQAISYFGTLLAQLDTPTLRSEGLGWAYHLSNGVSFGLMYAVLVPRPGPATAILWGLGLEGAMLLTPYAEVFSYRRDWRFFAITIGAHACYGATLWLALRHWSSRRPSRTTIGGGLVGVGLGLALIAADFHRVHAASLSSTPPEHLGPDLYVTWDVPEPDRLAALWMLKRFGNAEAHFHFMPPFRPLTYGEPFDVPEAEIRRAGSLAATEVLLEQLQRAGDSRLIPIARMAHLSEVTPWRFPSDPEAGALAQRLRHEAAEHCGERLRSACLDRVFLVLDEWYAGARRD